MKSKALVPLVVALILGVATFAIGRRVLSKQAEAVNLPGSGQKVLVAGRVLPAGHELTEADLRFSEAPVEAISPTMFLSKESLTGRVLVAPAEPGQVLRQSMLAPEGTVSVLQSRVPSGMRAVTIAVNEFSGLAGLITPGVRVDLVATLIDSITNETFARTIVENVQVSAVGQQLEDGQMVSLDRRGGNVNKTVTLLVTPSQAAAIDLAFAKSKPRLVLRSSDDNAPVDDSGVTMAQLSGRAQREQVAAAAQPEPDSQVMAMLAEMQQQLREFSQAEREMAQKASHEGAPEATGSGEPAVEALRHSVRVFRGGSETREQFEDDGRPAEAGQRAPAAAPDAGGRQTQKVEAPAAPAGNARAAAGE